jgi:hypothetical protein
MSAVSTVTDGSVGGWAIVTVAPNKRPEVSLLA